jgi:KDO2-lipid IV(A) lauroyltransferase
MAALRRGLVAARDLAATALVVVLALPLWLLSWRAAGALGDLYGRVVCAGWGHARRTGMINLRRAYGPSLGRRAARRGAMRAYGSLGRSLAEAIQFARRHRHGAGEWRRLYRAEDPALAERLLADPRPKVFVTGHLGSWEVLGLVLDLATGGSGAALARRIDNPYLEALARRVRGGRPEQWIEKRGGAAPALARLRAGDSVLLLMDENGGRRGVFVDFFGRPASTHKTAALLALASGAPLVVGAAVRRPGPVPFLIRLSVIETAGRGPEAVAPLTRRLVEVYEGWVRDDPAQWRWVHWRWKHRPDGTVERYGRRELAAAFAAAPTAAAAAGVPAIPGLPASSVGASAIPAPPTPPASSAGASAIPAPPAAPASIARA